MSIHPGTHIHSVHLTIADLDRSVTFYQERLGFRVHRRAGSMAAIGAGGDDLLVLHASASAPRADRATGLYHFAVLVPSRPDLARALRHLAELRTTLQGFADHAVSEAIYLADPDGNGIEIYRDRPREEWPIDMGRLRMGSDPLDLENLLADAGSASWEGLAAGTRIGHVHLHVAHIAAAERFYRDGLGFDITQRYGGSATFLSAGGYHHHVAVNTWAGVGAPPPPPGAIGLRHVVVSVPDADALASVERSLRTAGFPFEVTPQQVTAADPSGNVFVLETP